MSILSNNAITYTVNALLNIIKPNQLSSKLISVENNFAEFEFTFQNEAKRIRFKISQDEEINKILDGAAEFKLIESATTNISIPILNESVNFSDNTIGLMIIQADIITLSFLMLSRYEESISKLKDKHDRFEFKNSISNTYKLNEIPIVDEYAYLLKKELKNIFSGITFSNTTVKIIPTHDIDEIRRFPSLSKSIRTLLGDIYLYKSVPLLLKSTINFFKSITKPELDPYITSIHQIIESSKKYNLKSEFYFMSTIASEYNNGYLISESSLKSIFSSIKENRMLIGIHGGYNTYNNASVFSKEKLGIEQSTNVSVEYNRQHFLRFDVNTTFDVLVENKIKYDSSLGYAEAEGFRCGTCHPYNPYNFKLDKPFEIIERPLIVMDVTLTSYRNYSDAEALASMHRLYERCKSVNGEFIVLWHNTYVDREPSRFNNIYLKFLEQVQKSEN